MKTKRYTDPYIHCSIVYISWDIEQSVYTDAWMDKENIRYTCTHNTTHRGILFIHEEKKILLFVTTWMDTEITMLSKINQRKINSVWPHFHVESKQAKLSSYIQRTEKWLVASWGRGAGRHGNKWRGLKYMSLHYKINHEDIMYSMVTDNTI